MSCISEPSSMSFCSDFLPGIRLSLMDRLQRPAVEFDMLTCPYVYRNTPLSSTSHLRRLLQEGERTAPLMEPAVIAIDHEPGQIYRIVRRTQKEYSDECRLFVLEMAITIRPGGTLPQQDISELAAPGVGAAGKADERRTSAP